MIENGFGVEPNGDGTFRAVVHWNGQSATLQKVFPTHSEAMDAAEADFLTRLAVYEAATKVDTTVYAEHWGTIS